MTKILEHHREAAYRAHTGTSFSPEKRAEQIINEYSAQLEDDLRIVAEKGGDVERYKRDYESHFAAWLSAKGNCISSMITGPANFPIRRAEKANNRESAKYDQFQEFRTKVEKALERKAKIEAIEAAGGELEMARKRLSDLTELQESMKRINKAHAAYKKNPQSIYESGLSEKEQQAVIQWVPRWEYYNKPFMGFELTNNNAKIKTAAARVAELERKEHNATTVKNLEVHFEGGTVEVDHVADRIKIYNKEKPAPDVIASYKKAALKWSPTGKCWQRQITRNALYAIEQLLKVSLS